MLCTWQSNLTREVDILSVTEPTFIFFKDFICGTAEYNAFNSTFLEECRLVLDADNIPMVVPFVHSGMQEVMPIGSKFPKIGKRVCMINCVLLLTSDISGSTYYTQNTH